MTTVAPSSGARRARGNTGPQKPNKALLSGASPAAASAVAAPAAASPAGSPKKQPPAPLVVAGAQDGAADRRPGALPPSSSNASLASVATNADTVLTPRGAATRVRCIDHVHPYKHARAS
jgi:hypothetical protein